MKCVTHIERDAVGSCRSRGRGLCPDCAGTAAGPLACGDACRAALARIDRLLSKEARRSGVTYGSAGVVAVLPTLLCVAVVVTEKHVTTKVVFGFLGSVLAAVTFLRIEQARRWKAPVRMSART